MKPGAVTYCPRCRKVFIAFVEILPLEPWETAAPCETDIETLTSCPRCLCETQILQLSDELRQATREDPPADE